MKEPMDKDSGFAAFMKASGGVASLVGIASRSQPQVKDYMRTILQQDGFEPLRIHLYSPPDNVGNRYLVDLHDKRPHIVRREYLEPDNVQTGIHHLVTDDLIYGGSTLIAARDCLLRKGVALDSIWCWGLSIGRVYGEFFDRIQTVLDYVRPR